jgi:RHS repeat-associated protein
MKIISRHSTILIVIAVTFFIFGFVRSGVAESKMLGITIPPITEEIMAAGQTSDALDPSVATSALPEVLPDVKPLDLTRPPTTEEIMAAGQLGGLLYHTYEVPDKEKEEEYNLSFGIAIQEWNSHNYKLAVELFNQHIAEYPDSPWVGEAMLHLGCYSQFNGMYTDADELFNEILATNVDNPYEGAKNLANKARARLGILKIYQYDFEGAQKEFARIIAESKNWRDRTYASHWIQRLSRYKVKKLALLNCGPQALAYLLKKNGRTEEARKVIGSLPEDIQGHNLKALSDMASSYGFKYAAVKLSSSDLIKLPLPAIMHVSGKSSSGGHYWILERVAGDKLELIDPQSHHRFRQSLDEFSKEWSGYALVIADKDNIPGEKLSEKEMAGIYAGCCGENRPEDDLGDPDEEEGPNEEDRCGLGSPTWSVNILNMNLYVKDIPLWYHNTIGPSVSVMLSYNSESANAFYEPFGNKWQFNYASYLTVQPVEPGVGNVTIYMPDGRRDIYTPDGLGGYEHPEGVYNKLTKISEDPPQYELKFPDNSRYFYGRPTGSQQIFLLEITDPHDQSLVLGYDQDIRLTTITDALGRVTTLYYNAQGLVEQVTDQFGRSALFGYDASRNLTSIQDMGGYSTSLTYDSDVYLTSIIKPTGTWGFYIEAADGVPAYSNDYFPPGYVLPGRHTWESYRVTITNPLGKKAEYFYHGGCGTAIGINTCGGYSWYVSPRHYVEYVDGSVNNYRSAIKTVYRQSERWEAVPDKIIGISSPERGYIGFGYDPLTKDRTSVTDAYGNTTSLTYDDRGNVTSITDPLGNVTQFTYENNESLKSYNKVTKMEFPFKPPTTNYVYNYIYDTNGNLSSIQLPDYPVNGEIGFSFDANGQLQSLTDPKGTVYEYAYDAFGYHTTTCIRSHGGEDTYTPNAFGRVTSHTDLNGNTLSYGYDGLDRITSITYPDAYVKRYYYDCCRLDYVTDRNGMTDFSYNAANRLTSVTDVYGKVITYGYDHSGNLISITYPPGDKTVTYTYDDADRLKTVRDWLNNETTYEYDRVGNLLKTIYPNGTIVEQRYDEANRLTTLVNYKTDLTVIGSFDYVLDPLWNRTTVPAYQPLNGIPPLGSTSYTHDYQDRLLTAGSTTFGYDENGNLISKTQGGTTTTYTWNYNNMLTDVAITGGNTYHYKYDGLGNRVSKTVNGVETRYIVDPKGSNVLAETDALGNVTAYYVYGLGLISKITPTGQAYYYHSDGLGSTIAITDSSGNIMNKYAYDAYGKVVSQVEDPLVPNPFNYLGKYGVMDDGNGLLYMRARYYDPEVGRFINKDPIGFAGGDLNLYAYVGNNAINFIDPLGLKCCRKPFWERVGQNFGTTNQIIPGLLAPWGLGMLTSGSMASAVGGITLGSWALGGFGSASLGGVTFTALETGIIAGGTSALNFAAVGIAWEVGVGIGSVLSTAVMPCD